MYKKSRKRDFFVITCLRCLDVLVLSSCRMSEFLCNRQRHRVGLQFSSIGCT
jgi:hypothetical protein